MCGIDSLLIHRAIKLNCGGAAESHHVSPESGIAKIEQGQKTRICGRFTLCAVWHAARSIQAFEIQSIRRSREQLSSSAIQKYRIQPWQIILSASVCGYLALGAATHSMRTYHWFMLAAIPAAWLAAERGRQFVLDWSPLFAFWLVYDRLRLLQPLLLDRVAVGTPYAIERWAFGWMAGGDAPAHAARAWLSSMQSNWLGITVSWTAQAVYFSHLFLVPLLFVWLWRRGQSDPAHRAQFIVYLRAFTLMNFMAVAVYLLLPVAPPWWISLYGTAQPSAELVAQAKMAEAMDGALIQRMIQNASQWFAAVPSLHGAYPVLLGLLAVSAGQEAGGRRQSQKEAGGRRQEAGIGERIGSGLPTRRRGRLVLAMILIYGAAMWAATVILNQHYVIDLMAGAVIAFVAWKLAPRIHLRKARRTVD
jgi:membrane-associated phospholipid phosphatase